MKYIIDNQDKKPAYLQLYYQLRQDIEAGAYLYGQKLPSKRTLAEETGKSVITIEHAYSLLCDEGYVMAKERSGYIVIYKESDFLPHLADDKEISGNMLQAEHITNFGFSFSGMSKTMRRVLLDYGETIFEKSDNKGCPLFREAISKYLNRAVGIHANPNQIIVGAGAEYLYGLAAQLLGNDKVFALENPSYIKIRQVYKAHGISYELLDLGNRGIHTNQLQKSHADILHITPFNSYPSGVTADASKRQEYLQWANKRNGYIIEDNYESELTVSKKNEETLFSLSKENRVIYINTFSRTISPSLRVGYMVLPEHLIKIFDKKLDFYSCTVSVFEQYLLLELLNSGEFERNINRIRRSRRKMMAKSGYIK